MPAPNDRWNIDTLDLPAYLQRIGTTAGNPDLATLIRLQRGHRAAIPFENLDIVLGRGVALDLDSIQRKLVDRRRGGYCYEHNLLFAAALERLGFRVTRLLARIVTAGSTRPRTHMSLLVVLDGAELLCDVGLGGGAPLEPIPLQEGMIAEQEGWGFGIGRGWTLRGRVGTQWSDLYTVAIDPAEQIDYDVANHYTSTHPRSPFVGRPLVQMSRPGQRLLLDGRTLTRIRTDGSSEKDELTEAGYRRAITTTFGLGLNAEELDRLTT